MCKHTLAKWQHEIKTWNIFHQDLGTEMLEVIDNEWLQNNLILQIWLIWTNLLLVLLSVKWAHHRLRLPEVTEGHSSSPWRPRETAQGTPRTHTHTVKQWFIQTRTESKWLLWCFFHHTVFWLAAQTLDNHQLLLLIVLFNLCLCWHKLSLRLQQNTHTHTPLWLYITHSSP